MAHMSLHLSSGRFSLSDLAKIPSGALTVIHGGAAPLDPGTLNADAAREAVSRMIVEVSKKSPNAVLHPEYLIGPKIAPRTLSELQVLFGAELLEADPLFNAGFGAALQEDGTPRVSAGFMESTRQKCSAVINALEVKHPSKLAFYLQNKRFSVLDGFGAEMLARELEIPRTNLITTERFDRWVELKRSTLQGIPRADGTGTIGVVSVSKNGDLAAMTSTGGLGNETVGRVGDTPMTAGNYCTDRVAISCTGYGEEIMALALAPRVAVRMDEGMDLESAMRKTFQEAEKRGYQIAAIAVGLDASRKEAQWCEARTTPGMVWAAATPTGTLVF
jgi:L-asparaginase